VCRGFWIVIVASGAGYMVSLSIQCVQRNVSVQPHIIALCGLSMVLVHQLQCRGRSLRWWVLSGC
jgi:hypothetical protein